MQKSDWAHYAGVMPHCIHFDTFNYCWNLYFPRLSAIISRNNAVNFILALFICNRVRCYGFSNKMRRTHTNWTWHEISFTLCELKLFVWECIWLLRYNLGISCSLRIQHNKNTFFLLPSVIICLVLCYHFK